MAYSTPRTWVAGEYPTAAQLNANVRDNVSFLANPPACRVYHNAAQSVANTTVVIPAFNSERFDTDTMHDTVTNNSRITINKAGLYVVTAHLEWAPNAVGTRELFIRKNGATLIGGTATLNLGAGSSTFQSLTVLDKFAATDYVEVRLYQSSGGALNVNSTANYSPEFSAVWVGLG